MTRRLPALVGLLAVVALVGALLPPSWSPLVQVAGRVFTLSAIVVGWLLWAWISQRRGGLSIHDRLILLRGAMVLVGMASRHRLRDPRWPPINPTLPPTRYRPPPPPPPVV